MEQVISQYQSRIEAYRTQMHEFVSGSAHEWRMEAKTQWTKQGIPQKLAEDIVALEGMISACDIAMLDDQLPQDLSTIGKVYYALGSKLNFSWLRLFLREFVSEHHWDRLAVASAINEIYEQQRRLTQSVLSKHIAGDDLEKLMADWLEVNENPAKRFEQLIYDIKASDRHDMAIIMVALRQINAIK
jgi:glutamate dehydrogenase